MSYEGRAPFKAPGVDAPCETFYKVFGDLRNTKKAPLFALHGGPGAGHECLLALAELPDTTVVFYDQIGCGLSTLLVEKNGDEDFWTIELFCAQLDQLISHLGLQERSIDFYGHSWGAVLGMEWAADIKRASNLRHLVLSSGPPSTKSQRPTLERQRKELPQELQDILERCEREKDFENADYEMASDYFNRKHIQVSRPYPHPDLKAAFDSLGRTPHTYLTMLGPSEVTINGSLRDWSAIDKLHKIKASTLLINGSEDTMQDEVMQPLFDLIPRVKWVTFDQSGHMTIIDQRAKHNVHLKNFLSS